MNDFEIKPSENVHQTRPTVTAGHGSSGRLKINIFTTCILYILYNYIKRNFTVKKTSNL